ncbi:distal tail protein Dit, partial [Clostridium sardiniense]
MAYEVIFAGEKLNDYCKVLKVKKSVLPPRENFSKAIPTMMGSYFTGFKYGEREITIEVGIVAISREDLAQKIRT